MEDKEIKLALTVKEINGILALIGKQPLGEVIELFNKIRTQALAQMQSEESDAKAD